MPRHGGHNLTDPERAAAAIAEYQAGASLYTVADRYQVAGPTFKRVLVAAGVAVRTKSEQCRLAALRQHDSGLRQMTRNRLHELYWGEEKPSLTTLAERLGVCVAHLVEVLGEHGIATRSPAEQLAIDGKKGRRAQYGRARSGEEVTAETRAKISAAHKGKRKPKEQARKAGLAHRKRETRICQWCGDQVTRLPSLFRADPESTSCGYRCSNQLGHWRRRFPAAPRPLILARLQEVYSKARAASRVTYEDLERLGAPFGAGEAEILAVLTGD